MFVTACSMDEYAEEKTEKNLIVRIGISAAETTNNIRLRSTFCIEAIQTRSIVRPLFENRASCFFHTKPCGNIPTSITIAIFDQHILEMIQISQ